MSTTAEGIERKKRIRAGHRAATTTMLNQIDPSLAAENKDLPKLAQLKMSKIETLKLLDSEILNLTEESKRKSFCANDHTSVCHLQKV